MPFRVADVFSFAAMLYEVELFCVGLAMVIDVVLLIVVLEAGNRRLTAIWLKWALAGTAAWHAGCFVHVALYRTQGTAAQQLDQLAMISMVIGLLTITSGILHAACRIHQTGPEAHPARDLRYAFLYLPVTFAAVITWRLLLSGERSFIEVTRPYHGAYLVWLTLANGVCITLFIRNRHRLTRRISGARFLLRFSVGLVLVTLLVAFYLLRIQNSGRDSEVLRLLATLGPVVPALIFAYYIFRRRLIPVVFERTLVYAACFLCVFYLHRLTVLPLIKQYEDRFQFDFLLVEGLLLIALILAYGPLRNRVNEGLRYLVGQDVVRYRDRIRELSVAMAQRSGQSSEELMRWFTEELRESLQLQFAEIHVSVPKPYQFRAIGTQCPDFDERGHDEQLVQARRQDLIQWTDAWVDRSRSRRDEQRELLDWLDLSASYPLRDRTVRGCVFLGASASGDRLAEEQIQTTSLLIDQLASVLENQYLQQQKSSAERRAVQQEKLSTLGLLSGSIAHEVRNPLSSIRTITTLMREDLPSDDQHVEDLDLILSEIDRLTETTRQLLNFARPEKGTASNCDVADVVQGIVNILGHLARQHAVSLQNNATAEKVLVAASRATVTDILLNVIKNGIEAAVESERKVVTIEMAEITFVSASAVMSASGTVSAGSPNKWASDYVAMTIEDSGAGLGVTNPSELFDPFFTSKAEGTGLGLYLVAERLREIGGDIQCRCGQNSGAVFQILLPISGATSQEVQA